MPESRQERFRNPRFSDLVDDLIKSGKFKERTEVFEAALENYFYGAPVADDIRADIEHLCLAYRVDRDDLLRLLLHLHRATLTSGFAEIPEEHRARLLEMIRTPRA